MYFERSSLMGVMLCYVTGAPSILCLNVPMEIFLFYKMRKKRGNKRGDVYVRREGSCTRVFSWGFGAPSSSHPRVLLTSSGDKLVHEPPLQQMSKIPLTLTYMFLHSSGSPCSFWWIRGVGWGTFQMRRGWVEMP